jgi:hypothetical protein
MEKRGQAMDRRGRIWSAHVVHQDEADEADFRFWYEGMTSEDRVRAVEDCLLSALKARGLDGVPRLRRVYRVIERKRR